MVSIVVYNSFAVVHGAPATEPYLNAVADHKFRPSAMLAADD